MMTGTIAELLATGIAGAAWPTLGGFIGSLLAFTVYCPNRRCCQMKTVRATLENPRKKE